MKISTCYSLKNTFAASLAAGTLLLSPLAGKAQTHINTEYIGEDTFEYTNKVPSSGTENKTILMGAPDSEIYIEGERKNAAIIVDLSKNILYHYDEDGNAKCAYLIASGRKSRPTHTGVRIVTHVESYPYKNAPKVTKRYRNPSAYGPKIICLMKIDPESGQKSATGEFIHGTNNPSSIGKYASLGCIRMDNEVIKKLSSQVKQGDIVIIKKD